MTNFRTKLDMSFGDGIVSVDERQIDLHDVVQHHRRTILDTTDAMVCKGLMALGWTPPADEAGALALLRRLEPHLDAIVCYASTMSEHEGNRLAADVRQFLKEHP